MPERVGGMMSVSDRLRNDSQAIVEKYVSGEYFSHTDIAKHYGCSKSLVDKIALEKGFPSYKTSSRMTMEKHPKWNGGRFLDKDGRFLVYVGAGKYQLEHRVIAERALGRKLKKGEVVHHINGDRRDNRNCNLLICTDSYHKKLEQKIIHVLKKRFFDTPAQGELNE